MADAPSLENAAYAYGAEYAVDGEGYEEYYGEYVDATGIYPDNGGGEGTGAAAEGYTYAEGYDTEWQQTDDEYAGYVYDPATGEYVYVGAVEGEGDYAGDVEEVLDEGDPFSSANTFGDEAYRQHYGEDTTAPVYETMDGELPGNDFIDEKVDAEAEEALPSPDAGDAATLTPLAEGAASTPVSSPLPSASEATRRKKKVKSKQERMHMRQVQLEKEEDEKNQAQASPEAEVTVESTLEPGKLLASRSTSRVATRPPTFLERERAKVRLRMRKMRAIRRTRMPLQVRILTTPRTHVSPLEIYFGGRTVEPTLSDLFWASLKGDLRRVQFLVAVENVSVNDSTMDPWHMEQTPLHWAAKGGNVAVIEYLLQADANPRSLDENGSLPLYAHLACWAGHVDATLALLQATDTRDLYVQDYDAALAPLDWAQLRGHTALVNAIEQYEDAKWLPKFVEDLVRGIIRYKIKFYKEQPKSPTRSGFQFRRVAATGASGGEHTQPNNSNQKADVAPLPLPSTDRGKISSGDEGVETTTPAPETASET